MSDAIHHPTVNPGVIWARRAGFLLGLFYALWGPWTSLAVGSAAGWPHWLRSGFIVILGIMLMLPFAQFKKSKMWKSAFGTLCVCCIAFVFVMVISVMFDYMAAAERDERLGVPGFEGTLIFLTLMQPPAVLFQRRPDFLD
ncbi:MAG: hypothetical protein MK080_02420 [Opitutales bacterium]|nr:hypothetical protein [Opitutales bacterium]NRA26500.1 hypothetical protein [Opitutales bacterium]